MEITAEMVKKLRASTGVQMMLCKKALVENDGDLEKATMSLRKMGADLSSRRDSKETNAGIVYSYNHNNSLGVMVKLCCETDFVAKNEEFVELARVIAMHIAWAKPVSVDRSGLSEAVVATEHELALSQIPPEKEKFAEKIIEGKMNKVYERLCLMNQKELQVSEGKTTIEEMIKALSGKVGEKIVVNEFSIME